MPGKNLDYGTSMSNSNEGEMAKKTLIGMARHLYNLYIHLNDEDDLPQWCHYKLAKSEDSLRTVTDYLINKITKHCLDNNINKSQLQTEISSSLKKEFINEGFFDVFSKSKNVSIDAILNQIKGDNQFKNLYFFLHICRSLQVQYLNLSELTRLSSEEYNILIKNIDLVNESPYVKKYCSDFGLQKLDIDSMDSFKVHTLTMIKIVENIVKDFKQKIAKREESLSNPKITSARKKKVKKSFLSRLFGESEERRPKNRNLSILGKVLVVSSYFKHTKEKVGDERFQKHREGFYRELMKYSEKKEVALNILRSIEVTLANAKKEIRKNESLFKKSRKN